MIPICPPSDVDPVEWSAVRDRVHLHEEAHKAAAGDYAIGEIEYRCERGSDRHILSGSLQLDAIVDSTKPDVSLRKMQAIIRTALAPARPTARDQLVAKTARHMIQQIHEGIFPCFVQILGEYEGYDVCAARCRVKFCWGDERQQRLYESRKEVP